MAHLSVLMSLYIKEKPEYAKACFDSLLKQTVQADEWVIVEDGPLSKEMYELLTEYEMTYPGLIKRIPLKENHGLGFALQTGVPKCKNELVARMDTDDISREDRFEKQLNMFEKHPDLDICGSHIDEFEVSPNKIVARRTVPIRHSEIVRYQKRRDAFNHMTVMFKKSAVLKAGNYKTCPLMEDTYLWLRMIGSGAKCANIDESLVFARIGYAMYERRGGWQYFRKYENARKMLKNSHLIGFSDYIVTVSVQLCVAMIPGTVRGFVFKKILHK